jgi:hypothetical protein
MHEGGTGIWDVDNYGNMALICAYYGELQTVRWLLEEGGATMGDSALPPAVVNSQPSSIC